ncbi:ABC-type multidrug transport system, ATPase and permease components [[Eubacterium] siraeum 70/3]|uniref:ABC-type multidrug transport system, ATPase and permease components n=1 Tax=[Eubacterium] siraeum 70/3 TaxID=657319 RepID=D4JSN2_9FIRM|nr:ABC transporter ATP-binding protein [Ruminiclostridium sp.]MBS6320581.1 ABC transporter ATP-binding protein [[Eubacterium] siraeum]CBK96101.1 ABC-type multidrug transport system, ATPase and permease components [[Eubacterium] siraeum 70/3]
MILEVSMDLLQPTLMSDIVDNGILGDAAADENLRYVLITGLKMLVFSLIGCFGGIASAAFGTAAAQKMGNDLRKDAFAKVMHMSFQQTDKFTTGSLVTRLTNDITAIQEFVAMSLRMFVRTGMQFIGGIAVILTLNVNFGIVLVISLPVQLIAVAIIMKKASPLFSIVQSRLDKVNSVVQENVSGARVVKAFTREEYEINRFDNANTDLMTTNLKVQKLLATLNPILMIIMNASVIAIIMIGGFQVEAKAMQVGEVMAAVTYITQILMSVMMVGMMFQQVSRSAASMKRVNEVLSTNPVISDGNKSADSDNSGTVEFRNVGFSYPGSSGKPVLSGIDLKVGKGQMIAILGSTGCGKTSLVNLVPRFYDATNGDVLVDGVNVKDYDVDTLRSKIGVVLQKSELFSGTVAENIRWGCETATDEEVKTAAKIAQAEEFIDGFNDGYDTMISEKGASLSGGQKQRMAIARAIIKKPEILIFDDSTSALDLSTEAKLHKALRENLSGVTVIMIAQRIASVMRADKIAVLENGSICAFGTHKELMESSSVYRDIYYSQMKQGEEEAVNG